MFNAQAVYRKTELGVAEVQSRSLGLRAKLRRLLILIDGAATLSRLSGFVRGAEIDRLVAELEGLGLVTSLTMRQTLGQSIGLAPTSVSPRIPTSTSPVAALSDVGASATVGTASDSDGVLEPSAAQVLAVRQAAVRTLHDILGPEADTLAMKIEACKSAQALRVTITEVRQTLDRQMGPLVGQRFLDAVRGAAAGGAR